MLEREQLHFSAPDISVIYAGGTISSFVASDGYRHGGQAAKLFEKLRIHNPSYQFPVSLRSEQFAYLGLSENINYDVLNDISQVVEAGLNQSKTVIVTHGTDSMEHTAQYLRNRFIYRLENQNERIFLTGSNEDLAHPHTDAWDNLQYTLNVCNARVEPNVYVCFHGKTIPAQCVRKEPFNGIEMNYLDHRSYEFQEMENIQESYEQELIEKLTNTLGTQKNDDFIVYPVNCIRHNHQAFIDSIKQKPPRAIIFKLYHSGTADTQNPNTSVVNLIHQIQKYSNPVMFAVTENGEPSDLNVYSTSRELKNAGVVPLYNMTEVVASAKLALLPSLHGSELMSAMQKNLCGEIDKS